MAQDLLNLDAKYFLQALAQAFNYERGDLPSPFFDCFRERGYLSKEQLVWLVDWKTAGRQRKNAETNSEDKVRQATQKAFEVASKDVAAAIDSLRQLSGVQVAVASAVLTAWNPQDFGIIDRRAWGALRKVTRNDYFDRGSRTVFLRTEYELYVGVLRELKKHTGMSCHELDKALWVLGKAT